MPTRSRLDIAAALESTGLIAVIRADSSEQLIHVCRALLEGGVTASEITMTTPGALTAIADAAANLGDKCLIGVGSVLDAQTARSALLAGAQFVVSPTLNVDVIRTAHRYGKPVIPGALTPTEILHATEQGADFVKVFPANHFGPRYFKDVLAPMPHLRLVPTGGVDLGTAADWLAAGAACLGVGSSLVKKDLIGDQNWSALTELAHQYVEIVRTARAKR